MIPVEVLDEDQVETKKDWIYEISRFFFLLIALVWIWMMGELAK